MICASFTRVRRVLRDLIIISHLFEFVKGFSKSFLKNFSFPFEPLFLGYPYSRRSARLLYHIQTTLSRGFAKVFSTFLWFFSRCCPLGTCAPLVDSLHIIALHSPFVKRFFPSFSTLESIAFCHKYVVVLLCISTAFLGSFSQIPLTSPLRHDII